MKVAEVAIPERRLNEDKGYLAHYTNCFEKLLNISLLKENVNSRIHSEFEKEYIK